MIARFRHMLARFRGEDKGTASVEFVLVFPVFLSLMLMSIELGFVTLRHTLLERGLDMAVRDIRLGTGTAPQHDQIKQMVCDYAGFIKNCDQNLRLEMSPTDLRAYSGLDSTPDCTDKAEPTKPLRGFKHGTQNQLMLLRACYRYEPFFPDDFLGKALVQDSSGQASIVSMTAFVQEPF